MGKKTKSVESITAKLHATVAELEAHANDQVQKAVDQRAAAHAAHAAADGHKAEGERAAAVASNIKALLGA
jgi:hypothetical protein